MISLRYGILKKKNSQKRGQVCGYQGQRTGLEEGKPEKSDQRVGKDQKVVKR